MTNRYPNIIGASTLFVLAAACAPATSGVRATTGPMAQRTAAVQTGPVPPREIHWFRNAAEMRGLYLEIYRAAGEQLDKLASENAPGTWAVILDADETVIDNSTYQFEQNGAPYTDSAWRRWVYRRAAPALPGAVAFTRLAHQLGGRVVIVTNRENALCDPTRETLRADSIDADLVLCRTTTADKNPRFQSVANGTASASLPALKVLMWVGDNIQDFPNMGQQVRQGPDSGYDAFGRTFFLLPNPMYGSWERVPYR